MIPFHGTKMKFISTEVHQPTSVHNNFTWMQFLFCAVPIAVVVASSIYGSMEFSITEDTIVMFLFFSTHPQENLLRLSLNLLCKNNGRFTEVVCQEYCIVHCECECVCVRRNMFAYVFVCLLLLVFVDSLDYFPEIYGEQE